jgi:hypothetical protein
MRRLAWFGLGVAVPALVVTRGRRWLAAVTPAGVVERVDEAGGRFLVRAQRVLDDFTAARREAELELRQQAGLD